jgi:hypothetical protein
VKLLNERCVPVPLNSFYGDTSHWFYSDDFMAGMWKHVRAGNGDWTVLMPDGQYLDKEINKGMAKWLQLPRSTRRPGAFPITPLKGMPRGAPIEPAPGTLILRIYQRNLKRTHQGKLVRLTPENTREWTEPQKAFWHPKYNDSFFDVMWLSESEWKSLIPADPRKGDQFPLPGAVKKRLLLWHLVNRTFCVGAPWQERDIRLEDLVLRVEDVSPMIRLSLRGNVLLEMPGSALEIKQDWHRTRHGYDASVLGFLDYDPSKKAIIRFEMVAIGDYWGGDCEGGRHAGVGRLPLGMAFELARGDALQDRILPCGGCYLDEYFKVK